MNQTVESCITQLIGYAGAARSYYIKAIDAISDQEEYKKLIAEGDSWYDQAHQAHFRLLKENPKSNSQSFLLLIHAEDQLASAETFRILAEKIRTIIIN